MVNVTYGSLEPGSTEDETIVNPLGTDVLTTLDGTLSGRSIPAKVRVHAHGH